MKFELSWYQIQNRIENQPVILQEATICNICEARDLQLISIKYVSQTYYCSSQHSGKPALIKNLYFYRCRSHNTYRLIPIVCWPLLHMTHDSTLKIKKTMLITF